jgi:hypothetical protein
MQVRFAEDARGDSRPVDEIFSFPAESLAAFDWVVKVTHIGGGCSKRFEATLFHCGPAGSSMNCLDAGGVMPATWLGAHASEYL